MKLKSMLFGAALACGFVVGNAASAATIVTTTTRANVEAVTGLTGGTVINFEDVAPGAYTQLTKNGVTFSGTGTVFVDSQFSGQYNLQGRALKGVSNKGMFFDFDAPITGFGFFFGASDLIWTLAAYDANDNLLETLQIAPTRHNNLGNFYGIKANGIASARLTTTSADYVGIDDFRTSTAPLVTPGGVPEPATWAMMILGFGGVGALLRRRSALGVAAA